MTTHADTLPRQLHSVSDSERIVRHDGRLSRWVIAPIRFWSKVNKDGPVPPHRPELGPCWQWLGKPTSVGYGSFQCCGIAYSAHRYSWKIHYGELSELCVLHKCDNRLCVRPDHLFSGTRKDNMDDKLGKGRYKQGRIYRGEDQPGSKLTERAVLEIRCSKDSQVSLARRFHVAQSLISMVIKRARWRHIP